MKTLYTLIFALLLSTFAISQNGIICGRVVDDITNEPI